MRARDGKQTCFFFWPNLNRDQNKPKLSRAIWATELKKKKKRKDTTQFCRPLFAFQYIYTVGIDIRQNFQLICFQ